MSSLLAALSIAAPLPEKSTLTSMSPNEIASLGVYGGTPDRAGYTNCRLWCDEVTWAQKVAGTEWPDQVFGWPARADNVLCTTTPAPVCAGASEPCFYDASCNDPNTPSTGCMAGNIAEECRFCGFGDFDDCPQGHHKFNNRLALDLMHKKSIGNWGAGPAPWAVKCGWDGCDGCPECEGQGICKKWCEHDTTIWEKKCKFPDEMCTGCPECLCQAVSEMLASDANTSPGGENITAEEVSQTGEFCVAVMDVAQNSSVPAGWLNATDPPGPDENYIQPKA